MDREFFYTMAGIFLLSLWIFSTLKFLADAYATLMFGIPGLIAIMLLLTGSFETSNSRKAYYAIASIIFGIIRTLSFLSANMVSVPVALLGIVLFSMRIEESE